MWANLHFLRDSPKGSHQGEDSCMLLTHSGGHQSMSHYRLTPSSQYGEPPSFMRLLRGRRQGEDPCRLLTHSYGHQGRFHYRMTLSNQCCWASNFQEAPRGVTVRVKTSVSCFLVWVDIRVRSYYRLTPISQYGRASNSKEAPWRIGVRVKTHVGCWSEGNLASKCVCLEISESAMVLWLSKYFRYSIKAIRVEFKGQKVMEALTVCHVSVNKFF